MSKPKKLFYKLIQCECGNNYRYQKDRGIPKWLCGGYSRGISNCERNAIREEHLIRIISAYCLKNRILFEPTHEFVKGIVDKIYISKEEIRVEYKSGEKENSIINGNMYKI